MKRSSGLLLGRSEDENLPVVAELAESFENQRKTSKVLATSATTGKNSSAGRLGIMIVISPCRDTNRRAFGTVCWADANRFWSGRKVNHIFRFLATALESRNSGIWISPALCLMGILLFGCNRSEPKGEVLSTEVTQPITSDSKSSFQTQASFLDVTKEAGVDFTPRNGEKAEQYSILETVGVGVAWFDIDNDGLLDLFVPGGGEFTKGPEVAGLAGELFHGRRGHYKKAAQAARLSDDTLYSHAAVVGDFDNDGFSDLLVTGYGALRLFQNCGDGTFLEIASLTGLDQQLWSTGAAWGDFNADGNLDLYVVNYIDWSFDNNPTCFLGERAVCSPVRFSGLPDALFLSDGAGRFIPAPLPAGADGKGLAALTADLDLDGDLDVFVANDTTPNLLFENSGDGSFVEVGIESGTAFGEAASSDGSMGIDVGDFNLDGLPDLWVANFEGQSFGLYENTGDLYFQHVSARMGISSVGAVYVGFGTGFFDFDCDGDEDIICVNGHVTPAASNSPFRQKPLLFENLQGKQFVNVASKAGTYMNSPHMARGLALGDIDFDGDLDVAIAHSNEPIALLRNESRTNQHWLSLQLIGRKSARTPIGARVVLTTERKTLQHRQLKSGTSFFSTHEQRISFGLGGDSGNVTLKIHWPSGHVQTIPNVTPNQRLTIVEP